MGEEIEFGGCGVTDVRLDIINGDAFRTRNEIFGHMMDHWNPQTAQRKENGLKFFFENVA